MWKGEDFVPAHLQSAVPFWAAVIHKETPESDRDRLLGWVKGESVHEFVDTTAQGRFQGHPYSGADLTPIHLQNHVTEEHHSWVTTEVAALV